MEENKNLTPENEDENTLEAEKSVEISEEVTEEAFEESKENDIAEDEEEYIEVVFDNSEEAVPATEEAPQKAAKGGVIAGIIAAVLAVIVAVSLIFMFAGSRSTEGTGNLYSQGFATVKGGDIYHLNFADYKLYKTDISKNETVLLNESDFVQYITNYKNDIYYLGIAFDDATQETVYSFKKYVDGVNDVTIVNEPTVVPQISDGYVYYLKSVPEFYSGYSSRIYRASLTENAQPELVCDVLCSSFYVDGGDLYYVDVETTAFVKTKLKTALDAVKNSPLPEGGKRSSAEIEAVTIIDNSIAGFPAIKNGVLYYIESLNQGELRYHNLKTGADNSFNTGVYVSAYNIYGDYIYYCNQADACIYRMNLDGSNVIKITAPGVGYTAISHDKFMSLEVSEEGYPYISVCDLEGNIITNITFEEQFDAYYDDAALELPEETEATEETETTETPVDAAE